MSGAIESLSKVHKQSPLSGLVTHSLVVVVRVGRGTGGRWGRS